MARPRRHSSHLTVNSRKARFRNPTSSDIRTAFQRDRDRVLYSSEFRRLSGVTQVVSASEGDYFHNRLTHSLKVAQVGRRLAERLLEETSYEWIEARGGLDPDVVETAGLAHDLGHPPFGHDGEEVLCQAVEEQNHIGGFEGNAQAFRIVTRLATHKDNDQDDDSGLNLSRATLNAILKYPWIRGESGYRHKKWGVYGIDKDRFDWVTKYNQHSDCRVLEAEIMDWADDVTYAVHDLEDFYRAGMVPVHLLLLTVERERFINAIGQKNPHLGQQGDLEHTLQTVLGIMGLLDAPYDGGRQQQIIMNGATSALITQFIAGRAIRVHEPSAEKNIDIAPEFDDRLICLRRLLVITS